jgi:hypothetical protein
MATRDSASDRSAMPRSLIIFALATLAAVAGIVVLAATDRAWALIAAVCVVLVVLSLVLRELDAEIGPSAGQHAAPAPDGDVADGPSRAWSGPPLHRRLLLVASAPVRRPELASILAGEPRGNTAVLVVAPALDRTWLRYWVSDHDEGIAHARAVEDATVEALRRAGVPADGHVGSADPMTAIEDALRFFDADRIVIAAHADGEGRYREHDLRAEVERRFGVPAYAVAA